MLPVFLDSIEWETLAKGGIRFEKSFKFYSMNK
jgi:hypothetical protein